MKMNKQFLNAAGRAVLGLALETVEPLTLSMIIKKCKGQKDVHHMQSEMSKTLILCRM